MLSAFGVDHGYDTISKLSNQRKERAEHYGRMSGIMTGLGGTAGAVGTGSGIVAHMEHKGKDPMGFTEGDTWNEPLRDTKKKAILRINRGLHANQAKVAGAAAAGGLALGYAYHRKKKEALGQVKKNRERQNFDQKFTGTALGLGAAGVGGAAVKYSPKLSHQLGEAARTAREDIKTFKPHVKEHNRLKGMVERGELSSRQLEREFPKAEADFARRNLKLGRRVAGVKGAGSLALAGTTALGGAGTYELARHNLRRRKS